ncbi:MAG: hypothetical protein R2734_03570 [Nocardioides sp.]
MHTRFSVACTWVVSPRTLTLKITSGADDIWSSQDCRGALERQEVTLRAAKTRTVAVVWDGRRSNPGCAGQRATGRYLAGTTWPPRHWRESRPTCSSG